MSLNKVMLIGNVGKDPEIRYLDSQNPQNNAKVATFPLATSERYTDRSGNRQENTEWHNIVAWRANADVIERFVRKGTQLYIEGRLRTRNWTDQTGNKRYTTEVIVETLQLLGKRQDNPGADGQNGGYPQPAQGSPAPQGGFSQQAAPRQGGFVQPIYNQTAPQPAAPAAPGPEDDFPF